MKRETILAVLESVEKDACVKTSISNFEKKHCLDFLVTEEHCVCVASNNKHQRTQYEMPLHIAMIFITNRCKFIFASVVKLQDTDGGISSS